MLSIKVPSEKLLLNGAIASMRLIYFVVKTGKNVLHVVSTSIHVMLMATKRFIDLRKYQGWFANTTVIVLFGVLCDVC